MGDELEADVREFILACGSVSQLEVLLLLRRVPDAWSPAAVGAELRIDGAAAATQLAALQDWGLLAGDAAGTYRYAPRHAELAALVDRVAAVYAERRVSVIRMIYSQPAAAVRQFAAAFRLRRQDDGDA